MAKTESYSGGCLDISEPIHVEIQIREEDTKEIWVNVDGVCKFSARGISNLQLRYVTENVDLTTGESYELYKRRKRSKPK